MSGGWTPGPWSVSVLTPVLVTTADQGDGMVRNVAMMQLHGDGPASRDEEAKANAHLIAAAPTMAAYIQRKADEGDTEAALIMETVHGRG